MHRVDLAPSNRSKLNERIFDTLSVRPPNPGGDLDEQEAPYPRADHIQAERG
jgi:hypothetical protein